RARPRLAAHRRGDPRAPEAAEPGCGDRWLAGREAPGGRSDRQRGVRDMGGRPPADGAASGRDATVDTGDYGAGLGSVEHDAGEHDSRHDQRRLIVTGLGPGDLARLPVFHRNLLVDPAYSVVVRTMHHPAAAQLAELRPVVACDDLYERFEEFEDVYEAIADRVADYMAVGATIYAVPGSPMVG